jgi:hypothetical protein
MRSVRTVTLPYRHAAISRKCVIYGTAVLAWTSIASCDRVERPTSTLVRDREVQGYVAGEALGALDPTGKFSGASLATASVPIDREAAIALAMAFIRSFGPSLDAAWERRRGAPIDLSALRAVERVFLAATPYEPFPEGFHPAFRRGYGPYYLVPLGSGGDPELLVAVSALASDVRIDEHGMLELPPLGGAHFLAYALPTDLDDYAVVSPEEAVVLIGRSTGARTVRVPELVLLGDGQSPFSASWRLRLDRSVEAAVRGGGRRQTEEVFVGPAGHHGLRVAAATQPTHATVVAERIGPEGQSLGMEGASIPVRRGFVTAFELVDLSAEQPR